MQETILVINAGSSSIKFQLFAVAGGDRLERRMRGQIEGIGTRPRLLARDVEGRTLIDASHSAADVSDVPAALGKVIAFLRDEIGGTLPTAVGHRVVHGGPEYSEPTIISAAVVDRLERFVPLAPLHQPNNLGPIRAILERQPQLLQVACFDTRCASHALATVEAIRQAPSGLSRRATRRRLRCEPPEVSPRIDVGDQRPEVRIRLAASPADEEEALADLTQDL